MCIECNRKGELLAQDMNEEREYDEDHEEDVISETITYNHVCVCGHVIAEHYYNYEVDSVSQEYTMECFLCGKGGQSL
jgi:hypothetical protein